MELAQNFKMSADNVNIQQTWLDDFSNVYLSWVSKDIQSVGMWKMAGQTFLLISGHYLLLCKIVFESCFFLMNNKNKRK